MAKRQKACQRNAVAYRQAFPYWLQVSGACLCGAFGEAHARSRFCAVREVLVGNSPQLESVLVSPFLRYTWQAVSAPLNAGVLHFTWFFGDAAAAGLTYIKNLLLKHPSVRLMPSSANLPRKTAASRFVCLKKRKAGVWTRPLGLLLAPSPSPGRTGSRPPDLFALATISAFGHAAAFATVPLRW